MREEHYLGYYEGLEIRKDVETTKNNQAVDKA